MGKQTFCACANFVVIIGNHTGFIEKKYITANNVVIYHGGVNTAK